MKILVSALVFTLASTSVLADEINLVCPMKYQGQTSEAHLMIDGNVATATSPKSNKFVKYHVTKTSAEYILEERKKYEKSTFIVDRQTLDYNVKQEFVPVEELKLGKTLKSAKLSIAFHIKGKCVVKKNDNKI